MSFELLNAERMIKVVTAPKLPVKAIGLADIIPVALTILLPARKRARR